jgi:hypothetical protein
VGPTRVRHGLGGEYRAPPPKEACPAQAPQLERGPCKHRSQRRVLPWKWEVAADPAKDNRPGHRGWAKRRVLERRVGLHWCVRATVAVLCKRGGALSMG